jgi:hypothetical protein
MLGLSEKQMKQISALQKDVDERLAKILSDEQRQQLRAMRERGPGGPGFGPPPGDGERPARGDRPERDK